MGLFDQFADANVMQTLLGIMSKGGNGGMPPPMGAPPMGPPRGLGSDFGASNNPRPLPGADPADMMSPGPTPPPGATMPQPMFDRLPPKFNQPLGEDFAAGQPPGEAGGGGGGGGGGGWGLSLDGPAPTNGPFNPGPPVPGVPGTGQFSVAPKMFGPGAPNMGAAPPAGPGFPGEAVIPPTAAPALGGPPVGPPLAGAGPAAAPMAPPGPPPGPPMPIQPPLGGMDAMLAPPVVAPASQQMDARRAAPGRRFTRALGEGLAAGAGPGKLGAFMKGAGGALKGGTEQANLEDKEGLASDQFDETKRATEFAERHKNIKTVFDGAMLNASLKQKEAQAGYLDARAKGVAAGAGGRGSNAWQATPFGMTVIANRDVDKLIEGERKSIDAGLRASTLTPEEHKARIGALEQRRTQLLAERYRTYGITPQQADMEKTRGQSPQNPFDPNGLKFTREQFDEMVPVGAWFVPKPGAAPIRRTKPPETKAAAPADTQQDRVADDLATQQ